MHVRDAAARRLLCLHYILNLADEQDAWDDLTSLFFFFENPEERAAISSEAPSQTAPAPAHTP